MARRIKQTERPLDGGIRNNVRPKPIEEARLVHLREAELLTAEPVIGHPHQVAVGFPVQKPEQQQRSRAEQKQEEQREPEARRSGQISQAHVAYTQRRGPYGSLADCYRDRVCGAACLYERR